MFGRLSLDDFLHESIVATIGQLSVVLGGIGLILFITYLKRWKWLWREWFTSVDPKKIGVMYLVVAAIMLLRGGGDAAMMRVQQALSAGGNAGFLDANHFQQVFTAHGSIMIFFVAMGLMFGLINLLVPLQIGARDVAFPFLNATSFWLFFAGAMLMNISLVVGEFGATGWLAYPPLSGTEFSPGVGVDYWIWSLQIAGVGSMLSGVNFLVTILKMRAPGMTLMKMPLFTWSVLNSMVLVIFAFPILTATLALLSLDRIFGMHFFTSDFGGNPMMYVNLIWAWGHPEVYILILPAFGIFSEVVATFSRKRLFGYKSMVFALGAITFLSFVVWLHHFFTMGAGPKVNAFFGIMTMIIAIPTGVKIFNWLFTMYRGHIRLTSPMLWFLGFVLTFTIGGATGVLMAVPPADFQLHNSLFLVAHFHNMIIGGVLFGYFAGITYWFPKIFGFALNEFLGKCAFWAWTIGFLLAFIPLYILGLMGATRRLDHYDASLGWQPLFIVAGIGVAVIFIGLTLQILQLVYSTMRHKQAAVTASRLYQTAQKFSLYRGLENRVLIKVSRLLDAGQPKGPMSDPWDGRTLEWQTSSPPKPYNFAAIPEVTDRDPFWEAKHSEKTAEPVYADIHMPKNTPMAIIIAALAFMFGFAVIWHIWWLAVLMLLAIITSIIIRTSDDDSEYTLTAAEVKKMEANA